MSRLEEVINGLPFTLTDEQELFIRDFVNSNGHATLLGDSGVGKTTVMWVLKQYYKSSILFGGSSGIATVNLPDGIGYATGHKIFKLSVGEAIPSDYKRSAERVLTQSDMISIVVLDEAFCYNSQDLDQILNQIRKLNKRTRNRKERNIRLLLVGDVLQRLPVVDDKLKKHLHSKYGHYLMFRSNVWKRFDPKCYVLQQNKRQEGDDSKSVWFRKALHVIRYGVEEHYDKVLKGLNKLVVGDNYETGSLYLAPTNDLVNKYNEEYLNNNPNTKYTFKAQFDPKYDKKEFPMEKEVTIAEGCSLITLINNNEAGYQNGTEITVTSIIEGEGVVGVKEDGTEVFVELHEFKQEEIQAVKEKPENLKMAEVVDKLVSEGILTYEQQQNYDRASLNSLYDSKVKDKILAQERIHIASAFMLPVKLSAGFVIARSQGRTFNRKGLIDVGVEEKDYFYTWNRMPDFMVAGLFVALGRFTSIDHIQLKRPIEKKHIKVDRDSINFWWECVREFNKRKENM